jgi:hypothetical protein
VTRQIKCLIASALGGHTPAPTGSELYNGWDPTPKPYIFMIRVTRQIKYLIAQAPGVIPLPLPEVNFLMVEVTYPKPYILIIRVNRQMKCPKSWGLSSSPSPTGSFFIAKYKTRPNDFDLQLVLVSCPKGQVKKC